MSIHSSLRSSKAVGGALRNVLKRHERVRFMMEQGTWVDGGSVVGLPKIKQTRLKVRKAAAKEKEASATPAATPAASPGSS